MRHGILLLYEELNRIGIEWTLGPLALAFSLGLTYEPLTDIAIYVGDLERLSLDDISNLRRWSIVGIFRVARPGFLNRSVYVRGIPCISPRDILESLPLNTDYPYIHHIVKRILGARSSKL